MTDDALKLTIKQEAFARAYVETGNASEAYRRSYNVKEDAKPEGIWVDACKLLHTPNVSLRVAELQAEVQSAQSAKKIEPRLLHGGSYRTDRGMLGDGLRDESRHRGVGRGRGWTARGGRARGGRLRLVRCDQLGCRRC